MIKPLPEKIVFSETMTYQVQLDKNNSRTDLNTGIIYIYEKLALVMQWQALVRAVVDVCYWRAGEQSKDDVLMKKYPGTDKAKLFKMNLFNCLVMSDLLEGLPMEDFQKWIGETKTYKLN